MPYSVYPLADSDPEPGVARDPRLDSQCFMARSAFSGSICSTMYGTPGKVVLGISNLPWKELLEIRLLYLNSVRACIWRTSGSRNFPFDDLEFVC